MYILSLFLYSKSMFTLKDLGAQRKEATLSNGLRVVLFERPDMPVYLRAAFLGGARFDTKGKEGAAHFLEHMLVAGTRKFPSKDKLAAYIEQYGGVFGATTWQDDINVNVGIGEASDIDRAFEILHEILLEPLFDDHALETERGSILSELRDALSNPGRRVFDVAEHIFFQGTPLARPTLGTEESVKAITKEDILATYQERITAQRMLLVVSGGVTLEQVIEKAERVLILPSSERPKLSQALPVIRKKNMEIECFPGKEQVHAIFGFRTVGVQSVDEPVLDVIAEVLGGGRASVLVKKLRYERGLVYGVSAQQMSFGDAGLWIVKTSATKQKLQEVLDIISGEIQRIVTSGLSPEELQFAKDKIAKSKRMELQSSGSWVGFHAYHQLLSEKPWTFVDYVRDIQAVTVEDTKRIAQKYFLPDSWYLALCGDITADEVGVRF